MVRRLEEVCGRWLRIAGMAGVLLAVSGPDVSSQNQIFPAALPDTFPATTTRFEPVIHPFPGLAPLKDHYGIARKYRLIPLFRDSVCIIGTGDIMLGTNYPSPVYLPPGEDCSPLLRPVHGVFRTGDLLFGNLEGVFSGSGGTPKGCRDTTQCYVFRMPDHFLGCLIDAGYDVLSVANNHVNDFGPGGRAYTAALLDSAGMPFAGFVTHPWTIFENGGLTYGFAAFAPNRGTMDLKDYAEAARITQMLDTLTDIVIISFHGGAEGRKHEHVVRGDEVFLGYNRGSVYRFAHTVVDAGADVVFGHGPHVTRAMELYRDRLICYSLGNFATYRRFNLSGPNGIAPIVKVWTDQSGRFLSGEIVPVYQPGEGGPRIDPRGRVITRLIELSAADFPEQDLRIETGGRFYRRSQAPSAPPPPVP